MRAIVVIHYVSTLLFYKCLENNLLKRQDWEKFDIKESVIKSQVKEDFIISSMQNMYRNAFSPEFVFRRIIGIKNLRKYKNFIKST